MSNFMGESVAQESPVLDTLIGYRDGILKKLEKIEAEKAKAQEHLQFLEREEKELFIQDARTLRAIKALRGDDEPPKSSGEEIARVKKERGSSDLARQRGEEYYEDGNTPRRY